MQRYSGVLEAREFDQFTTVQDLSSYRRRTIDIPKVEAELEVKINPKSKIEFEVEFEHGGTGTAVEYETDETGEFESEVEKGGEVVIEEIFYQRKLTSSTDVLIGQAPVYFSLGSIQRKPLMFKGTQPSNLEGRMIPLDWTEPGVQFNQRLWDFTGRAGIVAGMNSEFFRSYNWVGGGHQKHFEDMNFDQPAYIASLEWGDVANGRGAAFSYYTGNTSPNRRKRSKVTKETKVELFSAMANWSLWRLGLKGEWLYGELQNSETLSVKNNTLVGLASPGNFNALGSRAQLQSLQLDYEFIDGWTAFGHWDHVNTFASVQGDVYKDPRYDVRQLGWGITHTWDDVCAIKFEHYREWTKLPDMPTLSTYVVQFAFDTGDF